MSGQPRRLDSWKEIAEYLGRDVRTVMRWSKTHGLPVRRVAGTGRSVFAFAGEIDVWLAGQAAGATPNAPEAEAAATDAAADRVPPSAWRRHVLPLAAAAAGLTAIAGWLAWSGRTPAGPDQALRVVADENGLSLTGATGAPRPLLPFDAGTATRLPPRVAQVTDIDADGEPDVLVGLSYFDNLGDHSIASGELHRFSAAGKPRWKYVIESSIRFRDEQFDGPWVLRDWAVGPAASPARIALASHHSMWWASTAIVLDHDGRAVSTFVNPGWLENVIWLDLRRLAVSGFNNARDAAAIAIVDADARESRAPGTDGTPYACLSCTGGDPLFYATFPRSELNLVTASRFNRAQLARLGDRLIVTTTEAGEPEAGQAAVAIYEFDAGLRLVRARYDDRYWDLHRQLEIEGRLPHSRADCPSRNGPPAAEIWTPHGWQQAAWPH